LAKAGNLAKEKRKNFCVNQKSPSLFGEGL
jgi:hypothetical protein